MKGEAWARWRSSSALRAATSTARGSKASWRRRTFDAIDGTGAGDAFAAGFLYGRLAGWPLERSAALANAAGALATTAVGAVEGIASLDETLALADLRAP